MNWIVLVLLSTFIGAGASVLDKRLMDRRSAHPFVCAASFGVVGLPVAVVGLIWLPPTPWPEALMGLIAGGMFIAAAWLYYDTVAREEISRLAPLLRLTSVQTLLLATVFLGDALNGRQLVAFGVMLVGGLLLVLKPGAGGLTVSQAAWRMVPVTTLLAVNGVLMAHVYRAASLWAGVVWENVGMALGTGLLGLIVARSVLSVVEVGLDGWMGMKSLPVVSAADRDRRIWGVLIVEQATRLITGLVPAWAIAHGVPAALLSALGGVRPAWVWFLAVLLLGERVERRDFLLKGSGILGMGLGMYWLM